MFHSLICLVIALGQQSLAHNDGLGSMPSSFGFDSTFDTAVPEDPTASMVFVEPDISLQCPIQPYESYLFSQNPPVVYVASFVNDAEARHLIQQRFVRPIAIDCTFFLCLTYLADLTLPLPLSTVLAKHKWTRAPENPIQPSRTEMMWFSAWSNGHATARNGSLV